MRKGRLTRSFYTRPTLKVARELLGKYIVRKIGEKKLAGKIIETEAYIGPGDKASHAYLPRRSRPQFGGGVLRPGGKITPRNRAEYFEGGHIYIYLVYGMYWQLNISTSREGKPECVLIRALVPVAGQSTLGGKNLGKLADGPGKLCRYLKLNKSFYGEDLTKSKRIWLEDPALEPRRRDFVTLRGRQAGGGAVPEGDLAWQPSGAGRREKIKPSQILATARIGIDYAGPYWSRRKWRFVLKD